MPARLTLGKVTVNGTGAVTVSFLCRVPDKIHSAKSALPINFLPCELCRVQYSLCRVPQALGKEAESSSAGRPAGVGVWVKEKLNNHPVVPCLVNAVVSSFDCITCTLRAS